MERVHISAGKGYNVLIGSGLLNRCGELLREIFPPRKIAVITDKSVEALYLKPVLDNLAAAGFDTVSCALEPGEASKNMNTLTHLLEFLAENGLTRSDTVAALGGGVVGDAAGFAAGCYMRGVDFVQLPTTLLAAVDSSVGGKTAVDLRGGKNLAGLFLQPSAVLCDTDALKTLPPSTFSDGAAEAIKAGILGDAALFTLFETADVHSRLDEIITRCVSFKGKIVEADEFEAGLRKTLNLGHTIGHAIEKLSGYQVTHGHAIAAGTAIIAKAADSMGIAETTAVGRIVSALERNGLPVGTNLSPKELAQAALTDKKRRGDCITLVLPRSIGDCILQDVPVGELEALIAAGMN